LEIAAFIAPKPYDLFTARPHDSDTPNSRGDPAMELPPIALGVSGVAAPRTDAEIRQAAESFEATFLAEMLRHTGLNAMPAGFGGGAGEEAFGSLLTEQYARLLAERGGIGLAERVFEILKQGTRDA
jgi:hypothetical protein